MADLILVRHAQASFGTADYDRLSDLGHRQSNWLGDALAMQGVRPDRIVTGTMRRHRETAEGLAAALGHGAETEKHSGLNEYDFTGILAAHHKDRVAPADMHTDRRAHFRALRDTLAAWQRDEVPDPPESWADFAARVEMARRHLCRPGHGDTVLAVSSGGPIAQIVARTLEAPTHQMIRLNLQMKNTSITRFIFTESAFYLHSFNATPHLDPADRAAALTYS